MAIGLPWPPFLAIKDRTTLNGESTSSTSGADLWGSGTNKTTDQGPSVQVVTLRMTCRQSTAGEKVFVRLEKSTDGSSFANADPASNWFAHEFTDADKEEQTFWLFTYEKTGSAQEYLRLRWKVSAGTVTVRDISGSSGYGGDVHQVKFPTW